MPNGHQEDTRPLWQRVKDKERELKHEIERNDGLRTRVQELETANEALILALKLTGKEGD